MFKKTQLSNANVVFFIQRARALNRFKKNSFRIARALNRFKITSIRVCVGRALNRLKISSFRIARALNRFKIKLQDCASSAR